MLMRGGTSKGLVFEGADLPDEPGRRDDLLLRLMGSPDERQIDGLGGAHPLTSKVAVVTAGDGDADLDYLFLQVAVDEALVSDRQNCGNMLAAVAPFAFERRLLDPSAFPRSGDGRVEVRIRLRNTGGTATATLQLDGDRVVYSGDAVVAGVPGTGAPIRLDFDDIAGSSCGALLPTGNVVDTIDGVDVTLIDNGMPVVVLRADAMGITGTESPDELEADAGLRRRLESIRLAAGPLMGLGDVSQATVPKLTMVSAPTGPGALGTRTFIPHRCHQAIGVLGAVSVATAARLPGSPAAQVAAHSGETGDTGEAGDTGAADTVLLEHPTGTFEAAVTISFDADGMPVAERSGIIRTARKLMDGMAYPRP